MPFPKLLLRKRLWFGVVALLGLAGVFLYVCFREVSGYDRARAKGWKLWKELASLKIGM